MVSRGGFGESAEGAEIDMARLIEVHGEDVIRYMDQNALRLMARVQKMADSVGLGDRHSEVPLITGRHKSEEDPQKRSRGSSSSCSEAPPLKRPEGEFQEDMERDAPPTSLPALRQDPVPVTQPQHLQATGVRPGQVGLRPGQDNWSTDGRPEVPELGTTEARNESDGLPTTEGLVYGLGAHRLLVDENPGNRMDEPQVGNQEPQAQNLFPADMTSRRKGPGSQFNLRVPEHQPEMEDPGTQLFLTDEEWMQQQPSQQPSGSVGPEVHPPHQDQVDQGWGIDWEDWRNGVDYGLGQLFPQVTYLTEEVENMQQQLSPQLLGERFEELFSQSTGIKDFTKSQIDGQILALSNLMKLWINEAVAPLGPQIENKTMEKFQFLERGLETQFGQLFRLLNEQNREAQESALRQQGVAASRAADLAVDRPEESLGEIRRHLQDFELNKGLTKELTAQVKALFSLTENQQKVWEQAQPGLVTRGELKRELEKLQGNVFVEQMRSKSADDTLLQKRFDHLRKEMAEQQSKVAQQFQAFSERVHAL